MTTQKRRACNALIPLMLVLSCLLSACQNGPVDQAQTCEQRVIPVVTRLRPLQPVSEGIYVSNGDIIAAFNAGNGTVNWCSSISAGNGKDEFDGLNSQSGSLYAYTEAGTLTSFRAEAGTVLWSTNIEEDAFFNMTPPALVQTTIYGGTNTLYALNTSDGSLRWQFALPAQAHVRYVPVTTDGALYASVTLASLPQQVYALDATNGTKQWLFSLSKTQGVFGQPIAGDGVVVFPYDEAGGPDDQLPGGLEALSASSGKLLWQKAIWTIGSLGVFGNRVIANGMLYVIEKPSESPNARPSLSALDPRTGAIRWQISTTNTDMDDSLLVVKNVLYSVNPEGTVSARNAQTGQLLWQTHLHQPASAAAIIGRLMFLDGSLFVGAVYPEQKPVFLLHAFNTTSHKEDWYANLSEDGSQEGLITETT